MSNFKCNLKNNNSNSYADAAKSSKSSCATLCKGGNGEVVTVRNSGCPREIDALMMLQFLSAPSNFEIRARYRLRHGHKTSGPMCALTWYHTPVMTCLKTSQLILTCTQGREEPENFSLFMTNALSFTGEIAPP